ncbi:three-Cys-motif partner protein TcmP [uncultured Dokdonia sp.]|uniref:three-Cys-motif partner protein TcmP n=1 Tax=uncultured Dokdonia sp. TaxID=575653 RepID=UPI0030EC0AA4|tara:strand:+ start:11078 stop:12193 length:1116 start_codon:yes stop_codon:yes gene_type:complete
MITKKSQVNLLNHSEAKVQLFGDYIQKYLNIICNDGYTKSIHIIDLFCGPGVYDDGGEGSPVIALKKIKQTFYQFIKRRQTKSPKIHCHFNDIDQSRIEILDKHIKENKLHNSNYGTLNLINKDYTEIINELPVRFKGFKESKAFVFIDPFGYKDVKAEHILNLLDCNKKSEVLLWLPIQFMYRFSKNGTPDVLESFNSQLGIKKEELKNEWEYISTLKEGFQNFIGNNYFVDSFSLKKEENTIFCLFFFSSHIRGYEKMLETKWEIDSEQGRGWKYNSHQSSLFSDLETNKLEDFLLDFLKINRTNGEVFEFTLRKGFLPKHSTQILKNLQTENRLEVKKEDNSKIRRGAFYLNYKDYKNDFSKLIIKLK